MKTFARGSSVLELAAIIGIVAMLCAVAFPAYQDFAKRAKVADLVRAASACGASISQRYAERTAPPPAANGWGCEAGPGTPRPPAPSRHVLSVTTSADGAIFVTARNFGDSDIDEKVLTLTPLSDADQPAVFMLDAGRPLFGWRCGSKADHTTIDARYLPRSCRG
jgi:type IV pilus assembly protein PilA